MVQIHIFYSEYFFFFFICFIRRIFFIFFFYIFFFKIFFSNFFFFRKEVVLDWWDLMNKRHWFWKISKKGNCGTKTIISCSQNTLNTRFIGWLFQTISLLSKFLRYLWKESSENTLPSSFLNFSTNKRIEKKKEK